MSLVCGGVGERVTSEDNRDICLWYLKWNFTNHMSVNTLFVFRQFPLRIYLHFSCYVETWKSSLNLIKNSNLLEKWFKLIKLNYYGSFANKVDGKLLEKSWWVSTKVFFHIMFFFLFLMPFHYHIVRRQSTLLPVGRTWNSIHLYGINFRMTFMAFSILNNRKRPFCEAPLKYICTRIKGRKISNNIKWLFFVWH